MYSKIEQFGFFSKEKKEEVQATHFVIKTSVDHLYEHSEYGKAIRNALYIKAYTPNPNKEEQNPVVFFHGGPGIVNQEQYSIMQNYFTALGHPFYIPEVEGSGLYSNGELPEGFELSTINSKELKLVELKELKATGLNEFTKNYVDDIKDVLNSVSELHPDKKIYVITHSLGSHQMLRAIQYIPDLGKKIEAICSVAGTSEMGANRFWSGLNKIILSLGDWATVEDFENNLESTSIDFLKSSANSDQKGPKISKDNNPSVNKKMNQEISVLYGDVSCFPPILLLHAKDDQNVFFQNSVLLQEKIEINKGTVHGLYFTEGGHQFIKNEGNSEIRSIALKAMNDFFKKPYKMLDNNLDMTPYEDVMSEFSLFLEDKNTYLNGKFQKVDFEDEEKKHNENFFN